MDRPNRFADPVIHDRFQFYRKIFFVFTAHVWLQSLGTPDHISPGFSDGFAQSL